ncbi:FAD-dependent oxidoreductase [Streptomyces sp. NPDC005728]|uniref:hydroxysqualene dehydroxylase n=1 Tax=Streptomyces sp. NPDC005728 TaxID=3157054 RepID=UPI0033F4E915
MSGTQENRAHASISRRKFAARAAGAATVALGGASFLAPRVFGATTASRGASNRRVAVLGGGVGGLTAAQELAERGFTVTVYERKALGGKARSIPVPDTGAGGRPDLPGEHGFRFFPGFYQNVPDTMRRIPAPGGTVKDNLVTATRVLMTWNGTKFDFPASLRSSLLPDDLLKIFRNMAGTRVPPRDAALFASKMVAFLTSGPQRRMGQWEATSYADFIRADTLSQAAREMLLEMVTSSLVAAKPERANTRTIGLMAEAFLYSTMGMGPYTDPDQLLNAPTNEAWIDPWVAHLRSLGVQFKVGSTITGLSCDGRRITGAQAADASGAALTVDADWYVLAVPVERASRLLSPEILAADPDLDRLRSLTTDWMNGVMIYTTKKMPISHGHVTYAGQPWALTSISQAQFWNRDFSRYGDGKVRDCLSVDLSNWNAPGILYGKPAKQCSRQQIVDEVVAQIRKSLPDGDSILPDSAIHSWFVDPAITGEGTADVSNDEPLLINTTSSWNLRPEATTAIENFFLASDYVRSNINLATMEGANEAGRAAANGILAASGTAEPPAEIAAMYAPPVMKPLWAIDDLLYQRGLPNQFDIIAPDAA